MSPTHQTSLRTNGDAQVLTIPPELALPGTEVLIRKEGERLIIEPMPPRSLLSLLATLQAIPDPFPDVDAEILPLDDIAL
jgi:antitoxin VapB